MAVTPISSQEMLASTYEPKRSNRWQFKFLDDLIPSWMARVSSRPGFTMDPIEIDYLNTKRYLAGKMVWNTITLGLYDPIAPSASQRVMEWVRLSYENLSGRAGYPGFYQKMCELYALDPVGAQVEKWSLKNAWITSAEFGDLDMASAEPVQINLTLRVDSCVLEY